MREAEREQHRGHPPAQRDAELLRQRPRLVCVPTARLLVAEKRTGPGAQTDRVEPVDARASGVRDGGDLRRRTRRLTQQAEVDLGDRREGQGDVEAVAVPGGAGALGTEVRALARRAQLARA